MNIMLFKSKEIKFPYYAQKKTFIIVEFYALIMIK